jgi:hypothetical protein
VVCVCGLIWFVAYLSLLLLNAGNVDEVEQLTAASYQCKPLSEWQQQRVWQYGMTMSVKSARRARQNTNGQNTNVCPLGKLPRWLAQGYALRPWAGTLFIAAVHNSYLPFSFFSKTLRTLFLITVWSYYLQLDTIVSSCFCICCNSSTPFIAFKYLNFFCSQLGKNTPESDSQVFVFETE